MEGVTVTRQQLIVWHTCMLVVGTHNSLESFQATTKRCFLARLGLVDLSCLIQTPLKLVPPGTNFSEKFVSTIDQPHERKPVTAKDLSGVHSCISRKE